MRQQDIQEVLDRFIKYTQGFLDDVYLGNLLATSEDIQDWEKEISVLKYLRDSSRAKQNMTDKLYIK